MSKKHSQLLEDSWEKLECAPYSLYTAQMMRNRFIPGKGYTRNTPVCKYKDLPLRTPQSRVSTGPDARTAAWKASKRMGASLIPRDRTEVSMGAILNGKYTLHEDKVLGAGVSSTVLAATHDETGLKVAIKIIKKLYVHDWDALNRELEILQRIRCTFTVNLLEYFQDDAYVYMIMQEAEGGEMLDYMKKYGLEEMPKLAPWFVAETVVALQYLHDHGILHRDVKPENILLTGAFHVKLADYGSAIWTEAASEATISGTPQYTDPVVLQGGPPTAGSDWWSLGCVIYHMFVGHAPWQGRTIAQIVKEMKAHPKVDFHSHPYFPDEAKDLVKKLLIFDRTKRLGSGPYGSYNIRNHAFFNKAKVDWDNLLIHNNCTHYNRNYSRDVPSKYQRPGETILLASITLKAAGPRALKKQPQLRQLILTSYPRLFYLDPVDSQLKGMVSWDQSLYAEATGDDADCFKVHTGSRTYTFYLEGDTELSRLWVQRINMQTKGRPKQ